MNRETVLILEPDSEFALSLETSLKSSGYAVQVVADSHALLAWLTRQRAAAKTVVVLNVAASERAPLLRNIARHHGDVSVVITIERASIATAVELMHGGAAWVLHKPYSPAHLKRTLAHLAEAEHTPADIRHTGSPSESVRRRLASLSPRQRQILAQVFDGRINKVIAHRLGISIKTVELHRARMMAKMQAASAVELIRMTSPFSALLHEQVNG